MVPCLVELAIDELKTRRDTRLHRDLSRHLAWWPNPDLFKPKQVSAKIMPLTAPSLVPLSRGTESLLLP
jgi:hypothetical protein